MHSPKAPLVGASGTSMQKQIHGRWKALKEDTTCNQFLVFEDVPNSVALKLSQDNSSTSKLAHLSYNLETRALVTRIMPSPAHEAATRLFLMCIHEEIEAMHLQDEIGPLGSTTVELGHWRKEPDESWGPYNGAMTMVLEVGLWESSGRLAIDARGWLEAAGTSVQAVLTVCIDRRVPRICIRQYEVVPRRCHVETRASTSTTCCRDAVLITRGNGVANVSGDIVVPFRKFTGRNTHPNPQLERDLTIPRAKLQVVAEHIWRRQGFL